MPEPRPAPTRSAPTRARAGEGLPVGPARQARGLAGGEEHASCWVRTTQTWAARGWASSSCRAWGWRCWCSSSTPTPPPVVTGCLYNAVNTPPGSRHEDERSCGRSRPHGQGTTSSTSEDGAARRWCTSARRRTTPSSCSHDHKVEVKHDEVGTIDHDQTWTVGHDRVVTVKNDDTPHRREEPRRHRPRRRHPRVTKNLSVTVFETSTFTVSKTHTRWPIDEGMTVTVGGNSGTRLEMLPQNITLTCGASTVKMVDGTITLGRPAAPGGARQVERREGHHGQPGCSSSRRAARSSPA